MFLNNQYRISLCLKPAVSIDELCNVYTTSLGRFWKTDNATEREMTATSSKLIFKSFFHKFGMNSSLSTNYRMLSFMLLYEPVASAASKPSIPVKLVSGNSFCINWVLLFSTLFIF